MHHRPWTGTLIALVLLLLCSPTPVIAAPVPASNLGFESVASGLPRGWTRGGQATFEVAVDSGAAHGGSRSVRVSSASEGRYGSLWQRIAAAPLVGKRVRLHGWVRTQEVSGWATVWLRVDGGQSTYVMADGPLGTSDGWSEVVADAVIAPGREFSFGVALVGRGTAWFDDLSFEVIEPAPRTPIRLAGQVVDSSGAPVPGAVVALVDADNEVVRHVRTSADGGYVLETTTGEWSLSAHAPGRAGLVGAFLERRAYTASAAPTLTLGSGAGVTVSGRAAGVPAGSHVRVGAIGTRQGDVWAVPVDAAGVFTAMLPRADRYSVALLAGGFGRGTARRDGDVASLDLAVFLERPAPAGVVEWISRNAVPLATTEPHVPLDDRAPLRRLVGDARVVGLGEATHGTREFFRLKHRLFRELVAEGFHVFALEAGQVETRAIDDYVRDGTGTARTALANVGAWIWETEEFLELIEWMRAWNADPAHTPKLRFVGYDMQNPAASLQAVRRYLEQAAPDESAALLSPLEVLAADAGRPAFAALDPKRQAEVVAAVAALNERFDASRSAWEAATSPALFTVARQDARVLQQATNFFASRFGSAASSALRDSAMAENIRWLRDQLAPGTRMVVSAHNLHIADVPGRMGRPLRRTLGREWLAIGLELGGGTFQALREQAGDARSNVEAITLSPPPAGQVGATLLAAGPGVYALDLRTLPATGEASAWFRAPQLVREVGYGFVSEAAMTAPQVLAERYDALIFVAHTTRARPLPIDSSRLP